MGLRDIIDNMPDTRKELADYVIQNYSHIAEMVKNPDNRAKLDGIVSGTFDKYSKYMGGMHLGLSAAGHAIGYAADLWMLKGDLIGALGGKWLHILAQIPDKSYGLWYGVRTGNYIDAAQNIMQGMVSYVPGLTFIDEGLTRIIQKRMVHEVARTFENETGLYKPWTRRLYEKLASHYANVKDRAANVFRPDYGLVPA
jgi:hypothetical protein